jgi:hypothetical protein
MIFDTVLWVSDILPEHMGLEETKISVVQAVWNYLSGSKSSSNELLATWNHLSDTSATFSYKDKSRLLAFVRTLCRQAYREASDSFHPDEAAFALSLCHRSRGVIDVDMAVLERESQGGDVKAFVSHAGIWAALRRFILTENGNYALAPQIAKEGDLCAVISGMSVPVILRKIEGKDRYSLVGEAFVLGKMDGEVVENAERDNLEIRDILLS